MDIFPSNISYCCRHPLLDHYNRFFRFHILHVYHSAVRGTHDVRAGRNNPRGISEKPDISPKEKRCRKSEAPNNKIETNEILSILAAPELGLRRHLKKTENSRPQTPSLFFKKAHPSFYPRVMERFSDIEVGVMQKNVSVLNVSVRARP